MSHDGGEIGAPLGEIGVPLGDISVPLGEIGVPLWQDIALGGIAVRTEILNCVLNPSTGPNMLTFKRR